MQSQRLSGGGDRTVEGSSRRRWEERRRGMCSEEGCRGHEARNAGSL